MHAITTRSLACGADLVHEHLPSVPTVAIRVMVPVGIAGDDAARDGESAMLSEWVFRGAGGLDSRAHSDALDRHGVDRSVRTGLHRMTFGSTMLADQIDGGLPLFTSLITAPAFPDDGFDPVRRLCVQAIEGLPDDPQHLVSLELRRYARPAPYNRSGYGTIEALEAMDPETVRASWAERCGPRGAIVAVAGGIDADTAATMLDTAFEGWSGGAADAPVAADPIRGQHAVEQETAQVHIAMAWDAPPASSDDAILAQLANAVLSGSTSARLFTEVRAKRSLCYSVGAAYRAGRDRGLITLYAGTTPERAQETLDVSYQEVMRLAEGIEADEFDRAKIGLRSRIVMRGESTPARASALASDRFTLGRARSLQEVLDEVDAVSLDQLRAYVAARDLGPATIVTIGPTTLDAPDR